MYGGLRRTMKLSQAETLAVNISQILKDSKGIVGYKLARNLRMINEELREYYEIKERLLRKYGTADGDTLMLSKDSANYPLFVEEMGKIADQEVNFVFRKISEEEIAESGLSGDQIYLLTDLLEE